MPRRIWPTHLILVIPLVLMAAGCGDSTTQPGSKPDLPEEYATLKDAGTFKGSRVGYGGMTPPEVLAFRSLLGSSRSDCLYKRLLGEASTPGQLYALAGIYFTDPEGFAAAIQPYLESADQVETMFGCIVDKQVVSVIATSIASGALPLDLRGP